MKSLVAPLSVAGRVPSGIGAAWRRLGRRLRPSAGVVDLCLALALTAIALAEAWPGYLPNPAFAGFDWVAYLAPFVLALAGTVPVALRRRYPIGVMLFLVATTPAWGLIHNPSDSTLGTFFALMLGVFSGGLYAANRRRSIASVFVVVASWAFATIASGAVWYLFIAAWLAGIWLVGDAIRTRTVHAHELEERAARLERERDLEAHHAAVMERARIARELHDVVAHSLSVMVIQAAAAGRVMSSEPERARESMAVVETTGREALAEMRRLLGVLRREDQLTPLTTPSPSVVRLQPLLAEVRDAGLPVDLRVEGEPQPLPPGVDLSLYRVIQEALTNTLRHAGPARASVILRYSPAAVEVEVADDGRGLPDGSSPVRFGNGLAGMRERVALFSGEFQAGPRPGGGFSVRARLPLDSTGA